MREAGPVLADGSLNEATVQLLHAVSGMDKDLLRAARIRPSRNNWLHAPWYPYRRGGALTIGRTIWFTGIWFAQDGFGDGSPASNRQWLLHLAHEVGHLPQAKRFGYSLFAKCRYVAAFFLQYAAGFLLLKKDPHDCPLEREADAGRVVLLHLMADAAASGQLLAAVHRNDVQAVHTWCTEREPLIAALSAAKDKGQFA